ncbi:MAG: hypothetical protein JXA01_05370 [Dehalococcoidia bacterium]|nr:hypothetical protein [Dehalococcoidia bacterium]
MSSAKRVFDLQQIDLAITATKIQLGDIEQQLNHNEEYEKAKTDYDTAVAAQKDREKQYKDLDAEAEDLRAAIKNINDKLYGGTIKNPKELMGYEQEAGMLKGNLARKDDVLLELMENIDAAKIENKKLQDILKAAETTWQEQKAILSDQNMKATQELSVLEKKRLELLAAIDKELVTAYENIKSRKGQAVVRVEQGRCLGCRIMLSVSELQRVRGESIVTCSNCGRILYLS